MSIQINLKQAEQLLGFFGGEDADVVLSVEEDGHSGAGLYAHLADYPEEGSLFLDEGDS